MLDNSSLEQRSNYLNGHAHSNAAQLQALLISHHQVAQALRASLTMDDFEATLQPIIDLAEEDQIVFLNALVNERSSDAANIALALNTLNPNKAIRREARRTLIRLESLNVFTDWTLPSFNLNALSDDPASSERRLTNARSSFDALLHEMGLLAPAYVDVATTFLDYWAIADFQAAYATLAASSPLRAGLPAEAWITQRQQWNDLALPNNLRIAYFKDVSKEIATSTPTVEIGWSLEISTTPLDKALPELPTATTHFTTTGRHWFWCYYTLVEEDGDWRVNQMIDQGANTLLLATEELRSRLEEIASLADSRLNDLDALATDEGMFTENDDEDDNDEAQTTELINTVRQMEEAISVTTRGMHYHDALLTRAPGNIEIYRRNVAHAQSMNDPERATVYLRQLLERNPEERGITLFQLALMYRDIADRFVNADTTNRTYFLEAAIQALRESVDTTALCAACITLAMLLFREGQDLATVKGLLYEAQTRDPDLSEETEIEAGLAGIALEEGDYQAALASYERVAQIDPNYPDLSFSLGFTLNRLGEHIKAFAYLQALQEAEPERPEVYIELANAYASYEEDPSNARIILREGLEWNSDSIELLTRLAESYLQDDDQRIALRYLERAERVNKSHPLVQEVRTAYNAQRVLSRQKRSARNS